MKNRYYEYVRTIAEEGSFSRAAQKLYISQPALSAAVKKLEKELHGVPLFDRTVTPVTHTKAGRFYLEKAEVIDRLESEIDLYFSSQAGKRSGTLTIGSASFFCTYVLPGILRGYHVVNPECEIDMLETNVDQADSRLRKGEIDLLLDVEKMDEETFESTVLGKEYILLAVPASFPVNEKLKEYRISRESIISRDFLKGDVPAVDLGFLKDEPFLLLKKKNDIRRRAEEMCRRAGFEVKMGLRLDQMLTAYNIARNSQNGATFFRDTILRYTEPTDRLCYYWIDDPLSERDILISWRKTPGLSALGEDFVKYLLLKRGII